MGKRSLLFYDEMETPIGPITLLMTDEGLCRIDFGSVKDLRTLHASWSQRYFLCPEFKEDHIKVNDIKQQLKEYFNGERKQFSIKYRFNGTPFQQKVWQALYQDISYGEILSYKDIAKKIQAPKAIRAVGGAINKNPLSIIVPCHRVIGSNGSLVGYNGGMDKKKYLLQLEKAPIDIS
ncbi:methylated-DNA--[protein]-cysteine S-methyltransferase [Aquibacillus halophilus]|uniref:Methylated-DNA--protein-cysteine methyltransferase n=1 Tax=Aquibacillus halophilus TaxID=930132 RepID=A0A6A8DKZ5_9BACI|nr:methylated-DNA--[protein]-cysteine S-methyltransferase [Aquibacillus halophilus]MRH45146.1 methylated-DNA--[protein]-cysteine S-methyltransferase [Aquibacillus halophilus]